MNKHEEIRNKISWLTDADNYKEIMDYITQSEATEKDIIYMLILMASCKSMLTTSELSDYESLYNKYVKVGEDK